MTPPNRQPTGADTQDVTDSKWRSAGGRINKGLVAIAALLFVLSAHGAVAIDKSDFAYFVLVTFGSGALYLASVLTVAWGRPRQHDLVVILIGAAMLRAMALTPEPNLSTDAYRYVWDGRVQAAGFSPYLFVPADERLAGLRDEAIYPNINQKERAVTIYPPVAQFLFRAGTWISDGLGGIRIIATVIDGLTIIALLMLLGTLGLPRERVIIYAWHPLPVWEFVTQSHIDVAATALIVFGLLAAARGRQGWAGGVFAAATLVKFFPAVLLPAVWRRWDWRLPIAFGVVAAALYLPFAAEAGTRVIGFLTTHLDNEGYSAGWGFHPVWMARDFAVADPSGRAYIAVALVILFLLAVWALLARGSGEICYDRVVLLGAAFVWLTSPHYPWYFAFLVALLVVSTQAAVLLMTLLSVLLYLPYPPAGIGLTATYLIVYWLPLGLFIVTSVWASCGDGCAARFSTGRASRL